MGPSPAQSDLNVIMEENNTNSSEAAPIEEQPKKKLFMSQSVVDFNKKAPLKAMMGPPAFQKGKLTEK